MGALSYTLNKATALIIVILDATQVSFLPALYALKLTCTVWLWVGRLKIRDRMNSWFCIFDIRWVRGPAKAWSKPSRNQSAWWRRCKSISIIATSIQSNPYVNTGVYNRKVSFLHISDHKLKRWKYCCTQCACVSEIIHNNNKIGIMVITKPH